MLGKVRVNAGIVKSSIYNTLVCYYKAFKGWKVASFLYVLAIYIVL